MLKKHSVKAENLSPYLAPDDYLDMLMSAPIGVYISTPDGKLLYANSAMARIFGYDSPQEMIDSIKDIGEQLYADPKNREAFKRLLEQNDEILNQEGHYIRKDGSAFWGSYSVRAVRDEKENIEHYQGFLSDITEQIEERESLRKTQFAMDRARDSILWIDDEGYIVYANDSAATSMGYTHEELLTMKVFDIDPDFPPDNWEQHKEEVRRRGSLSFESRHRTKGGDLFPVEVSTNHFKHNDRYLACAFDRDISMRKQSEEKVKESEARFRALFKMAPVPLVNISLDGKILDMNDRLKQTMGYTTNDMQTLEQAWNLTFSDSEKKEEITSKWRKNLERALTDKSDMELVECPLVFKDGTLHTMTISTELIGDSIIVSFFDITDHKRVEEAMKSELQQLKSIFDSLNEIIYVSDPLTHEILFANKYLRNLIGDDPTGKCCYRALQGFDKPCDFCTNTVILNNGNLPYRWEYHNPVTHTDVDIVDQIIRWPDGRDVRLEIAENITERKRAEHELKESERKLRSIFAAMTDVIVIFDKEGRCVEIAPTGTSLLYKPSEELLGKTLHEIFPSEKADEFFAVIHSVLSNKKAVSLDYDLMIEDHHVWFASTVSPLSSNRVMVVARDITERKQLEEKFSTVFMMAPDMIAVSRIFDGLILDANLGFEEITGWKRNEVMGQSSYDINFWAYYSDRVAMVQDLNAGRDVLHREIRFRRKDGSMRNGLYSARSIQIAGEDLLLFVLQDITEKQETEKKLREKEAQLVAITENMPGVIFQAYFKNSGEYGISYVNDRVMEIFGIDKNRRDLIQYAVSRVHEDDRERLQVSIKEAVVSASPWSFEGRFLKSDDETLWFHGSSMPTRHKDQVVYDGFVVDITDRKRAEEEKEKLQDQLLQSQKMEAVGILAGGVAHDFNNMLGAIMGYSELSLDKMDCENPYRENMNKILDAAQRSASLARQLLTFARKEAIAPIVFDLNEAVEGLLKMLRRLIGENINLAWLPGSEPCMVKLDPSQFDQIMANLCVNAKDAIVDIGKITIKTETVLFDETYCATHSETIPGEYVLLTISDDGCGMDKETLNHIFEPFFTTKSKGDGTGLGLATVYGIVKQNAGFINVYSEQETGTSFKIYFPRHVQEDMKAKQEEVEKIPHGRGETILLIEDDSTLLEMTVMMLKRLGYAVLCANTPREAIRLAEECDSEIQMFITDVVMPEMNGRDLADRLRAIRPTLKHLFISGYTANVIAHHGVLDEGVNFLQKPFSVKSLALKIREIMD